MQGMKELSNFIRKLSFTEEYFGLGKRWKCAGCAYDQGYTDGFSGRLSDVNLAILYQSQAGCVRHRNPVVAYNWGYATGLAANG